MDRTRFLELCIKNGKSIAEVERDLGMSNGSLRKFGDIKSDRLLALANYFNVSMEYLMGVDDTAKNARLLAYIEAFSKADDKTKNIINQLLDIEGDKNED